MRENLDKRASISKTLESESSIPDMFDYNPQSAVVTTVDPEPKADPDVKRSQEQVFDYMDVIHEKAKKLEKKIEEDDDLPSSISELERKKKAIDDQRVKEFEKQLAKQRENEIAIEKQKVAQKKAEEKERQAIKELEMAKQREEQELERAK